MRENVGKRMGYCLSFYHRLKKGADLLNLKGNPKNRICPTESSIG